MMEDIYFIKEMFFYINSIGKQEEFLNYLGKSDKEELLDLLEVEK